MPSFRSSRGQARHRIQLVAAIGRSKPVGGSTQVHSLGTRRTYATSLGLLANWAQGQRLGTDLRMIPETELHRWLGERSERVGQKCLDNDRQAIVKAFGLDVPRLRSTHEAERRLAVESRAYSSEQILLVALHQSPRNSLSTRLVEAAGLRAQELLTIRLANEQPATGQRSWSPDLFAGLSGHRYTVVGKGGLIREVIVPSDLASELEAFRCPFAGWVRDREINYLRVYDIAGGNAWSKSFTEASGRALGYSHGGHGLRHAYAQRRMTQLQQIGKPYEDALAIVSQELGHFRPDITEVYLR
jgi:hypothetical protein